MSSQNSRSIDLLQLIVERLPPPPDDLELAFVESAGYYYGTQTRRANAFTASDTEDTKAFAPPPEPAPPESRSGVSKKASMTSHAVYGDSAMSKDGTKNVSDAQKKRQRDLRNSKPEKQK